MTEPSTLRLVDTRTGEITEDACPHCETKQFQLDELTRKYHGALAQIGRLRADREAEARSSQWWPIGISLFQDWKVASGRLRSQWNVQRFEDCMPYLRDKGFAECRYAIWGLCAHPMVKKVTADFTEVYDAFEIPFRNPGNFERYRDRGVAIFGADLPLAEFDALLAVHRSRAGAPWPKDRRA